MKTVFVGGGEGCRAVLELVVQKRLATLSLDILGVVDIRPDAPGMRFAREHGWATFMELDSALALHGLELVIELTGIDSVRDEIYRRVPERVRVMDHNMARVFWDLDEAAQNLRDQLALKTELEGEIRADRTRLQDILDSLPDLVVVVDYDGRIERVNRRFEEVTGMRFEDVVGRLCCDAVCRPCGTWDSMTDCPRMRVVREGKPFSLVQQHGCIGSRPDEDEAYHEVTASPVRASGGKMSVVVTSREVTEQVLLKRETEESARRFEQILGTVRAIITITDVQGRYQLVNPSAARFFGLEPAQMVGRTAAELFPPEVAQVIRANDEAILVDKTHRSDEEHLRVRGEERIIISERLLMSDYRGATVGICSVSRDVTRTRRMQQELLQTEKHAAVGKLAAGVAHEINNPLTGILSYAEDMMVPLADDDPMREDLAFIVRETMRCRQIVRDLLDFSRQRAPDRQAVAVQTIVRRALGLVQRQVSFQDIRFDLQMNPTDLMVLADPNQLQQVMLNLIINARDAMGGVGAITVRAEPGEPGRVEIEVSDQGCGIPAEHLPKIFEPFFSTKGAHGNGLGLAAVRSIIDDHGGRIRVESAPGQGATFYISLPGAREPDARTSVAARSMPAPGSLARDHGPREDGMR